MTILLARLARRTWTPPPGRAYANPGDRIVFGDRQARSREYTAVPVSPEPWQQLWRCPCHDVTWRGTGRCWARKPGETCKPVTLC